MEKKIKCISLLFFYGKEYAKYFKFHVKCLILNHHVHKQPIDLYR